VWNLLSMLNLDHPKFFQIIVGTSLVVHAAVLLCFCVRYVSAVTLRITQSSRSVPCHVRVGSQNGQTSTHNLVSQKMSQKRKSLKPLVPLQKQGKKQGSKNKLEALVKKEEKKPKAKKIEKPLEKKPLAEKPEKKVIEPKPVAHEHQIASAQAPQPTSPKPVMVQPIELDVALQSTGAQGPQEGVHSFVYARIRERWKPPRGIKPRSACKVRALIGKGRVEGVPEIVISSGNVLFDTAARRAVLGAVYPADIWNRVLIIHFS
jgi:outer membrane biosynthesis protein TonB